MNNAARLLHYVGMILTLGSILTYVVISRLLAGADLDALAFGRTIIREGTLYLTLPGMWLVVLTGAFLTARRYGFLASRWLDLKLALGIGALLNAHLVIVPATETLLVLARDSAATGTLHSDYLATYWYRESIPGAINVACMLAAMALGIWRPGGRPARAAAV